MQSCFLKCKTVQVIKVDKVVFMMKILLKPQNTFVRNKFANSSCVGIKFGSVYSPKNSTISLKLSQENLLPMSYRQIKAKVMNPESTYFSATSCCFAKLKKIVKKKLSCPFFLPLPCFIFVMMEIFQIRTKAN